MAAADCGYYQQRFLILLYANGTGLRAVGKGDNYTNT